MSSQANAAQKMAEIAKNVPKALPEGMGDLYDSVVKSVQECALKAMSGMSLTLEIPEHLVDYCPHIIGDLRSGGFKVDIIAFEPSRMGVQCTLFVTW